MGFRKGIKYGVFLILMWSVFCLVQSFPEIKRSRNWVVIDNMDTGYSTYINKRVGYQVKFPREMYIEVNADKMDVRELDLEDEHKHLTVSVTDNLNHNQPFDLETQFNKELSQTKELVIQEKNLNDWMHDKAELKYSHLDNAGNNFIIVADYGDAIHYRKVYVFPNRILAMEYTIPDWKLGYTMEFNQNQAQTVLNSFLVTEQDL